MINDPAISPSGSEPPDEDVPQPTLRQVDRASDVLAVFAEHHRRASADRKISLGDLVSLFGDRAFGMMLVVLAIPNVVPIPGLSTVVGIPMLLLGGQMIVGVRRPWLPRRVARAGFSARSFVDVIDRVLPRLKRLERLLRPRWMVLTAPLAERLIGCVVVVLAIVVSLPIVFGNLPPAIAIALMALGLIERDGGFVLAGFVAALVALAIVAAVVLGLGEIVTLFFRHIIGW